MPPPPRAVAAIEAMKAIGFHSKEVGPVLKKLLKVYDDTWELIEADGYQVLLDSILEERELKETGETLVGENQGHNSRKRLKKLSEANSSQSMEGPSKYLSESPKGPVPPVMNFNGRVGSVSPGSPGSVRNKRKTRETTSPPSFRYENGRRASTSREGDFITKIKTNEPTTGMEAEDESEYPIPLAMIEPPADLNPIYSDSALNKERKKRGPTSAQASRIFANAACNSMPREGDFIAKLKTSDSGIGTEAEDDLSRFPVPLAVISPPEDLNPSINRVDPHHQNADNSFVMESDAIPSASHFDTNGNRDNENGKQADVKPPHDSNDIAKGEERSRIPIINIVSNEKYPSSFHYTPQSMVYNNANVNFTLSKIGEKDHCVNCYDDCLSSKTPCACGEFAYTSDGLLSEVFINESISINQEPHKHRAYCQDCPLERCKEGDETPGKCKGHLVRKFIKECWVKCGCGMQCINRTVQRGITFNLQVFFTPEGKGWGLRTLDYIPKGAFVCEYAGEILTVKEVRSRKDANFDSSKTSVPMLLDNGWRFEEMVKDEDALCLDASSYGNVARFINHRCGDANLVAIPVKAETPECHYYHVAFFSARKIEQLEELTWDYGINFDDVDQLVKAFKCRCGSRLCRDKKSIKSRSKALMLL